MCNICICCHNKLFLDKLIQIFILKLLIIKFVDIY
nr:MAG TPA: hypothetical protein [Caudoviricetes sp.]DAR13153.1 MAG TPA: hypothetical protein [Caudoviricetes sp.]DAS75358.1 MAG TPA: hypothetical protein [Caudoviricetes sp.]